MQLRLAELEYELEAAAEGLEAEHDSKYRAARQKYLHQLAQDLNQPRHVRGWIKQEQDRLKRIERAQKMGRRGPGGSARYLRGVPGLDVGHKLGKHNQHHPANFRLEDARFNRARPGLSRRVGLFHKYREGEAELESALAEAAEQMHPPEVITQMQEVWRSLPPDVKKDIVRGAKLIGQLRGAYLGRFLAPLNVLFAQNPLGWQQALMRNRAAAVHQMAVQAGRAAGLTPRESTRQRGFSDVQVRQFHR